MKSDIELYKLYCYNDFEKFYLLHSDKRFLQMKSIKANSNKRFRFYIDGFCSYCDQKVKFKISRTNIFHKITDFRETIVCPRCKLNNRLRFMSYCLSGYINDGATDIYANEKKTPFYNCLVKKYPNINFFGSEYLGRGFKSGAIVKGIRHEDAEQLSFDDNSLDIVVSNDVLEHVTDYMKAIKEIYRVLREKGILLFSIPFHCNEKNTQQRAGFINGKLNLINEPIYHGNPLTRKGSLVFWDFGWDILNDLRNCGFDDAYILSYFSMENGHVGLFQHIIVAKK